MKNEALMPNSGVIRLKIYSDEKKTKFLIEIFNHELS